MKRILIFSAILASLLSCSNDGKKSSIAEDKAIKEQVSSENSISNFSIQDSRVFWAGTKAIGGGHSGDLLFKSGNMKFDENHVVAGEFEIDMKSMTCNDIKDKESNEDFLKHLKSEDFFFVEDYPTISAKLDGTSKDGGSTYESVVELTIKGNSRKEKMVLTKVEKNNQIQLQSILKINRLNYDITYNSGNIFKNLGDKVINDTIALKVLLITEK